MDQEIRQQLDLTRNSFFKLQENFNNNLLVIQELQEENDYLKNESEKMRAQFQMEMEGILKEERQAHERNMQEMQMVCELKLQEGKKQADFETQTIIQMMNEKTNNSMKYEREKFQREKKQLSNQIIKYEQSVQQYVKENAKLTELVKTLKYEKQTANEQLNQLVTQKQSYNNKFALHQRQLQNLRNSNNQWEQILKDKLKDANREKQKLQEEISQLKIQFKTKLSKAKEEGLKKVEQSLAEREKNHRVILQESKEIKYKYDMITSQMEKFKTQNENLKKENQKLERQLGQSSKKIISEKEIDHLKKMLQQDKKYLNTEIQELKNEKNQLKDDLKTANQRRQEAEKAIQRLKIALQNLQKQITDLQSKVKKLEKEKKQKLTQKHEELIHYRYDQEDKVSEHQNQQVQYSKYFSQDMGPVDDNFFMGQGGMKSSVPRSPKVMRQTSGPNHQLMKKIAELQIEIDQYKSVIKTMNEEIQRAKNNLNDHISLKDQEIKLCRDENFILRSRINEKDEQIISLNSIKVTLAETKQKYTIVNSEKNQLQNKLTDQELRLRKYEKENKDLEEKNLQYESEVKNLAWERDVLDGISTQLRSELEEIKSKFRNFDDSEEESFQEIQLNDHYQPQPEERRPKNKSRSKSGPKRKQNKPVYENVAENQSSMKLKDMIKKKKEFQMQGKKANISIKEIGRGVEKTGTESQKEIYEGLKRKSKEKPNVRVVNYAEIRRVDDE